MQVESAAWVTELKNAVVSFLSLVDLVLSEVARQQCNNPKIDIPRLDYAVALFCAVLAILSKSSTVMLPVVLGLCWWWLDGRWRWRNVAKLIPFLCVCRSGGLDDLGAKFLRERFGAEWAQTWPERLIIAGRDVCFISANFAGRIPRFHLSTVAN